MPTFTRDAGPGTDHAIVGVADQGIGIFGRSEKSTGTGGKSNSGIGVHGVSNAGPGVRGDAENGVGVFGGSKTSTGVGGMSDSGIGVDGVSNHGVGVRGDSNSFQGVFGHSNGNAGVVGESKDLHGVFGICHNPNGGGVFGTNDSGGFGLIGVSDNGIGVSGRGGRFAGSFEGDVEITGRLRCGGEAQVIGHLNCAGNVTVAQDISLVNADCAEDFDIAGVTSVEPGTVMVLGDDDALSQCYQPYDKRVAGVVSGAGDHKAGIVLDKRPSSRNRQPIALLGKVFCKVDAQFGAIKTGDLLTTSSTPGHAMKAGEPLQACGAVIGKALRPLQAGRGLIPILIALQ